mmetsp:Transcript_3532/g.16138  ORF Transcript_3532/g.16138 Transcript_3532/m.16138 type:complete len:240 (+) Transcript_3532:95-814(+)
MYTFRSRNGGSLARPRRDWGATGRDDRREGNRPDLRGLRRRGRCRGDGAAATVRRPRLGNVNRASRLFLLLLSRRGLRGGGGHDDLPFFDLVPLGRALGGAKRARGCAEGDGERLTLELELRRHVPLVHAILPPEPPALLGHPHLNLVVVGSVIHLVRVHQHLVIGHEDVAIGRGRDGRKHNLDIRAAADGLPDDGAVARGDVLQVKRRLVGEIIHPSLSEHGPVEHGDDAHGAENVTE